MLTSTETHVMLAIDVCGNDAYGLTIQEAIWTHTGRRHSFGVLYSVLNRLEKEKLIKSVDGGTNPERGGRPKKLFTLTGLGVRTLRSTVAELDSFRAASPALT